MEKTETICRNCGNSFAGNFCNQCGEKIFREEDKKISHLFQDATHFITHLDSKFLHSLRLVFFKPGFLSTQYADGIRKRYFRPISLFLITVVLYLLFPAFKGLNMTFDTYYSGDKIYQLTTKPIAGRKMKSKEITEQQLAAKYDEKSSKISKVLLLLYIPLTGLALYGFFYKQRKYHFDHFLLSTELNTFLIAYGFLLLPLLFLLTALVLNINLEEHRQTTETIVKYLITIPFFIVCAAAVRRFYRQRWIWTIIKTLLFLTAYIILVIPVYNIILFLTVMLFI